MSRWLWPWSNCVKERVCRYLLQHYLGHFFQEHLSLDQLSLDLYKGSVALRDIHLETWVRSCTAESAWCGGRGHGHRRGLAEGLGWGTGTVFGEASGSRPPPPGPLAGPSLPNQRPGEESLSSPLKGRNGLGSGVSLATIIIWSSGGLAGEGGSREFG